MTKSCFALLCQRVIIGIGEENLKSKAYIDAFMRGKDKMYDAHAKSTGGYISGEVKLTIMLRLLTGGDSLDLAVICDVYPDHCNMIMYEVLKNWILNPNLGNLNMLK